MKYIKIENKGVIDARAFTLVGGSNKRGDETKIGFFGSGLKYSLAYLIRNDVKFKVFADYNEVKFEKVIEKFRDKEFECIAVNGKVSDLTTAMGIDWEPWFVLREIYCNAIDEGDCNLTIVSKKDILPVEDKTVFYIELTHFKEIIDDWSSYFSDKRKDIVYYDDTFNQVYTGGDNLIVYRKGIRCFHLKTPCIFNYDLDSIEINESRVIKNEWDFRWKLRGFLQAIKDKKVITQILNNINNCWEKGIAWECGTVGYSDEWLEVIGDKVLVPYENAGFWEDVIKENPHKYLILPNTMVSGLKIRFVDEIRVIGDLDGLKGAGEFKLISELTKRQQSMLNDAISFLEKVKYEIKYPIKVVDFISKKRLGQAKDETILLSVKLFEMGRKELVSCIIEEQEHLVTSYGDETREFQTHFIMKLVTLMEEMSGMYL